jgi:hypothetical protein
MRGSASLTYSERVVEVFLPKVEMTTQINLTGVLAGALPRPGRLSRRSPVPRAVAAQPVRHDPLFRPRDEPYGSINDAPATPVAQQLL